MARVEPKRVQVSFAGTDLLSLTVHQERIFTSRDDALDLADAIYDFFNLSRVTRPLDIAQQAKENLREFFDDQSLFNEKAINDTLASTISQNDQLTNAALILANNVAAVMKLHGFTFDQAMLIVGVVMDKDE